MAKIKGTFSTKYGDVINGVVLPTGSLKAIKRTKWGKY